MQSASDLSAFIRKAKGDIPPPLVGASTAVVGSKMYLFGGRNVSLKKIVSDMYEFNLRTCLWTKIEPKANEQIPRARYFHSADVWNDHLVIFGGMANTESDASELCVLSDIRLFSLKTLSWLPPMPVQTASAEQSVDGNEVPKPRGRYAHLSSVTSSMLYIIGGQDFFNDWLDDIHVFDLRTSTWIMWEPYERRWGAYRSVAICATKRVRDPSDEAKVIAATQAVGGISTSPEDPYLGRAGARFVPELSAGLSLPASSGKRSSASEPVHLPYSCEPTNNFPNDIFVYSNDNFADVRRELEVLKPLRGVDFDIDDLSPLMNGNELPPGLRFPCGAILGQHLIIAGTYLASSHQSYSIWALDLLKMTWSRIDTGAALATGAWSRSVLWEDANRLLVFGNKDGNLVDDYNRRLANWNHVTFIDLEAFGIYQPPEPILSLAAQASGLATLEEEEVCDFELICKDGRQICCSRQLLEDRWPWFKERRREFLSAASRAIECMPSSEDMDIDGPIAKTPGTYHQREGKRPDSRLTPRSFNLGESYAVTAAFLQWIYSQALTTRLQHAPPVLSALLLLATTYDLKSLRQQVQHALHRILDATTAVGIYEIATLCDCESLQIRAFRFMMESGQQKSGIRPTQTSGRSGDNGKQNPGENVETERKSISDGSGPSRKSGELQRGYENSYATAQPIPGSNAYSSSGQKVKLALTIPSDEGHTTSDGPRPDPQFKFGAPMQYSGQKDSATFSSGSGNDPPSSTVTNYPPMPMRAPPPPPSRIQRDERPPNYTSDVPPSQQRVPREHENWFARAAAGAPPGTAEAEMRSLLQDLDEVGLTDAMTIGRPSVETESWGAASSMDHTPPRAAPTTKQPIQYAGPSRQEWMDRQFDQSINWSLPSGTSPPRSPYNQPPRSCGTSTSPHSTAPSQGSSNCHQGSFSCRRVPFNQIAPSDLPQPMSTDSGLFQMLPPSIIPVPPGQTPPRASRRPYTADELPITNSMIGSARNPRLGSDQNLRERYIGGAPGSRSPLQGVSPISPMSPATLLSERSSRTNSTFSGALPTPIEATHGGWVPPQGTSTMQSPVVNYPRLNSPPFSPPNQLNPNLAPIGSVGQRKGSLADELANPISGPSTHTPMTPGALDAALAEKDEVDPDTISSRSVSLKTTSSTNTKESAKSRKEEDLKRAKLLASEMKKKKKEEKLLKKLVLYQIYG